MGAFLNFKTDFIFYTLRGVIEKYSWVLLLIAIAPALVFDYSKMVVNLYRILVMLPLLAYCLMRPSLLNEINRNISAALFFTFWVFSYLSITWGPYTDLTTNLLGRGLSTYILLILIFLAAERPHAQHIPSILQYWYLSAGTCGLIITMVSNTLFPDIVIDNSPFSFGVFNHYVFVSWLAGSLTVIALFNQKLSFISKGLLVTFYLYCIVANQGRGGILIIASALFFAMLFYPAKNRLKAKLITLALATMTVLVLEFVLQNHYIASILGKGMNGRLFSWENCGIPVMQNMTNFIFGHGLSADPGIYMQGLPIRHCHSIYLNTLFYTGFIGFSLYVMLLLSCLKKGFRYCPEQPWPYLVVGCSVAFLVDANRFFVYPSALMVCFLVPLFLCMFAKEINNVPRKNSLSD